MGPIACMQQAASAALVILPCLLLTAKYFDETASPPGIICCWVNCRGKLITRVDNHIIWLEPFLKYNLGPLSWLYEKMRVFNGKLFGVAGRSIHRFLEWQHRSKVCCVESAKVYSAWELCSFLITSPVLCCNSYACKLLHFLGALCDAKSMC